jgi:hypothetical protein
MQQNQGNAFRPFLFSDIPVLRTINGSTPNRPHRHRHTIPIRTLLRTGDETATKQRPLQPGDYSNVQETGRLACLHQRFRSSDTSPDSGLAPNPVDRTAPQPRGMPAAPSDLTWQGHDVSKAIVSASSAS